jgi:enamine deaminase RidA (YjgF/YER057c/UK114 family)
MIDPTDGPIINRVYAEHIKSPLPNRPSIFVAALAIPRMRVEVVAYAEVANAV